MKNLFLLLTLLLSYGTIQSQKSADYSDVLIIANSMSNESMEIAKYFQTKRNIPKENIIYINIFPSETINDIEFEDMYNQIRNQMLAHKNLEVLNYIVTTKGVPLKINEDCQSNNMSFCKSIDEELISILSEEAIKQTSNPSITTNPFFNTDSRFSREEFDMFLVTRLDGYTVSDVKALIDRSGDQTEVELDRANIVFDVVTRPDGGLEDFYYGRMSAPYHSANDLGFNTSIDTNATLLRKASNVIGYYLINSETHFESPETSFLNGGIAELAYGKSGSTFAETEANSIANASDFIRLGANGISAYTHVTYLTPMTNVKMLFEKYFHSNSRYNLAESFYGAKKQLRLHRTIIGDPKSKVALVRSTDIPKALSNSALIYPNPTFGQVTVIMPTQEAGKLMIYDHLGKTIKTLPFSDEEINLDLSALPKGIYNFTFSSESGLFTHRIVLQ